MPHPDDNATTWRDLADELTGQERAALDEFEAHGVPAQALLGLARNDIEGRLADQAYCDVAAPADATSVGRWEKNLDEGGGWSRALLWREFRDREVCVDIDGRQHCDGTVERAISVYADDSLTLTSAGARRFAALLIEGADELDRLQCSSTRPAHTRPYASRYRPTGRSPSTTTC